MNEWIVTPQPRSFALGRLICFHWAGGSSVNFREWPNIFSNLLEVSLVQLPGRDHRFGEPFVHNLNLLVHLICDALVPFTDKPTILFGHSLGGLIGFEVSREMRRRGYKYPQHLIVSAARAPHLPRPQWLKDFIIRDFNAEVLKTFNGTSEKILNEPELMEILLARFKADFILYENYKYYDERALACPITVFGGKDDPFVNELDLMAWEVHSKVPINVHFFSGGHFFIDPLSSQVIKILQDIIDFNMTLHSTLLGKGI